MRLQHSIKQQLTRVNRKLFITSSFTKIPCNSSATISDLFIYRSGPEWNVEFELLDVESLILGNFISQENRYAEFYFFSSSGSLISKITQKLSATPRTTIMLSELVATLSEIPATFAISHPQDRFAKINSDSMIAERGYTGYEYINLGVKGYVHGNLDAVALFQNQVEPLGNFGMLKRKYTVQHALSGPAIYEFGLVNPTMRKQKFNIEVSNQPNRWQNWSSFSIDSLGCNIFKIPIVDSETRIVRISSNLYMARPVVFRTTSTSMDVFHG
jgi:hypothetical protein